MSCSSDWDVSALPAWGSAKNAKVIVAVESAGSWGRDAVGDADLVAPKGAVLYVVRSPGPHAETPDMRTVMVSSGFGDEPWMVSGILSAADISAFLKSDVVAPSVHERFGLVRRERPVLLVCTNGRRDVCCAVRGRPVVEAARVTAEQDGDVWEVSHIGGHRFAPTAIQLPSGQTFGRLDEADGATLVRAEISDSLGHELFSRTKHRGRVDLGSAECVAETWWREQHPELPVLPPVQLGASTVTNAGVEIGLPDGRRLLVTSHDGPELRDSCAKLPKRSTFFDAHLVE